MTTEVATDVPAATASRRRSIPMRTRVDYVLDSALLIAFTLDYSFQLTGLTIHEWIGFGLAFAFVAHVVLHWEWVLRTSKRLMRGRKGRESIRWIVDLLLLLTMTMCIFSGLVVSHHTLPAFGIATNRNGFWTGLHTTSADVVMVLVALHVGLSWRWILTVSQRMFAKRISMGDAR